MILDVSPSRLTGFNMYRRRRASSVVEGGKWERWDEVTLESPMVLLRHPEINENKRRSATEAQRLPLTLDPRRSTYLHGSGFDGTKKGKDFR